MALDPNVPLQVQAPAIASPMQTLAQIGQLRGQQQHQELQQQQIAANHALEQQRRQVLKANETDAAELETYKSIIGNPDLTPESFLEQVRTKAPGQYDAAKTRMDAHDKAALEMKGLRQKAAEQSKLWIGGMLDDIASGGYHPALAEIALKKIEAEEPDFKPKADAIRQQILEGGPGALKSLVDAMRAKPTKPAEPFTLSPGQTRYGPEGQTVATAPEKAVPPEKPPTAGSFEAYMGADPAQRKVIEAARKGYNQADDRPRVNVSVAGAGSDRGLSPDAVEYTATQYRILGPSGIPTRIEAADREHILNAAAEQNKRLGHTPVMAIQKQAAYKADATSLTKMRTMSSAAESFETKAISQADIVTDLSNKVGRSQIPLLNSAILTGKRELLGDPDTQLLFNAITTFSSEYAKIMEGSTGSAAASSDSARKAAAELVKATLNKGTLAKTVELMKKEMRLSIQGYDTTINHITERMGGQAPEPAGAKSTTPAAPDAAAKAAALIKKYGGG
jgi:hypothetical protein